MNATIPITMGRRTKVLLLDDDTTVLRVLGTALEARGFALRAATEGEGGVALLLDELLELDVLVVDLELPGRGARDILRLVRQAGGEKDLAVVVLAHDAQASDEILALGADVVVDRRAGAAIAAEAIAAAARRGACRRAGADGRVRDLSPAPPAPAALLPMAA